LVQAPGCDEIIWFRLTWIATGTSDEVNVLDQRLFCIDAFAPISTKPFSEDILTVRLIQDTCNGL
jgi:hypothetical protein